MPQTAIDIRPELVRDKKGKLRLTMDPCSREVGLEWALLDTSKGIPNAARAVNPTYFPVRSASDTVVKLDSLELSFDRPLEILQEAKAVYEQARRTHCGLYLDTRRQGGHPGSGFGPSGICLVGEMIGGALGNEVNKVYEKQGTRRQENRCTMAHAATEGDLASLQSFLPPEVFHLAVASLYHCRGLENDWTHTTLRGIGALWNGFESYAQTFAEGTRKAEAIRSASERRGMIARDLALAEEDSQRFEAILMRHLDIDSYPDIYQEVSEMNHEEVASLVRTFADVRQILKMGGKDKEGLRAFNEDWKASVRGGSHRAYMEALSDRMTELVAEDLADSVIKSPAPSGAPSKRKGPFYTPQSMALGERGKFLRQFFLRLSDQAINEFPRLSTTADAGNLDDFTFVPYAEPSVPRIPTSNAKSRGRRDWTLKELAEKFGRRHLKRQIESPAVAEPSDETKGESGELRESRPAEKAWHTPQSAPPRRSVKDIMTVQEGIKAAERSIPRVSTRFGLPRNTDPELEARIVSVIRGIHTCVTDEDNAAAEREILNLISGEDSTDRSRIGQSKDTDYIPNGILLWDEEEEDGTDKYGRLERRGSFGGPDRASKPSSSRYTEQEESDAIAKMWNRLLVLRESTSEEAGLEE